MEAYRIASPAHPIFDGAGAASSDDARWNAKGRYVVYACEHYATAVLEKAAQLNSLRIPRTLAYVRVDLPADVSIEEVRPRDLPGWNADDKAVSRSFGNRWYDERRSLILLVPSLAAPGLERNVLINQRHPEFGRLSPSEPEPLRCHPRLLL